MKALYLIPLVFSAFLLFLGISTRKSSRDPLANTLIAGGALVAITVITIWAIMFIKEKREKGAKSEKGKSGSVDSDS